MINLAELIAAQRDLQLRLGNDVTKMSTEQQIEFIKSNVLACTDELHEALAETGWKPWATSRHINAEAFFGELRDAWQFLVNMMLVVQPDPEALAEWFARALITKIAVNTARVNNYDGVSSKCPVCRRALDEVPIEEIMINGKPQYRCSCGAHLSIDIAQSVLCD